VDRYDRVVSQCFVGHVDVNEWLVAQGLALAYRRYSRAYVGAEDEARAAGRGVWAGTFEPPWDGSGSGARADQGPSRGGAADGCGR